MNLTKLKGEAITLTKKEKEQKKKREKKKQLKKDRKNVKQRKHSEDDVEPEDDEEEFEIAEEKNVENELRRRLIVKFGKKSKGESDELEDKLEAEVKV